MAPKTVLKVCDPAPNSGVFVLPKVMAPARANPRHDRRIARRHMIAKERRATRRANACRVDEILVGHRQAVQRADGPAARDGLVGFGRVGHRLFRDQRDDRVDLRVDAFDARKVRGHHFARRPALQAEGRAASSMAVMSHDSWFGGRELVLRGLRRRAKRMMNA